MRLALAKGGLWFFGAMIAIFILFSDHFKDLSTTEAIVQLLFYGFLAGGAAACYEWYQYEQEERKQRLAERRRRNDLPSGPDKTS